MTIIHNEKSVVLKMIAPKDAPRGPLKWSAYTLLLDADDGCLVWNTLTSMLIRLDGIGAAQAQTHPEALPEAQALYAAAFLVPADMDEDARLHDLEFVLRTVRKPKDSNSYSIFTTLGCNARCPYCFEKDMPKFPMSEETAREAVRFIQRTHKGDKVKLHWFGGEPLVGVKVIDLMSQALKGAGVEYESTMISNGYLFDADMIRRAVELWKLEQVQITLDGTEEVYNRTKGFVNAEGSAYKKVLGNIERLSAAGIRVNIRLNLSLENADNLLLLVHELETRIAGKKNVAVYAMPLYEYFQTASEETAQRVFADYTKLVNALAESGLYRTIKLPANLRMNHCMADNDSACGILPDGKLDKCRDELAMESVGDIWNGITDHEKVKWFKQRVPREEKCKTCLFAPTCTLLTACTIKCNDLYLMKETYDLKNSIRAAYRNWKEKGE